MTPYALFSAATHREPRNAIATASCSAKRHQTPTATANQSDPPGPSASNLWTTVRWRSNGRAATPMRAPRHATVRYERMMNDCRRFPAVGRKRTIALVRLSSARLASRSITEMTAEDAPTISGE